MPYYDLLVVADNRILSDGAESREAALAKFGDILGRRLTLIDQDLPPPYLMDEWTEGPRWVDLALAGLESQSTD